MPDAASQATALDHMIHFSGAFSWIGILEGKDEYSRPAIEVYLSERAAEGLTREQGEAVVDTVETFDALAFSLRHERRSSLYLVRESDCSPEDLRTRVALMAERCTMRLVIDEPLIMS